MKARTAVVSEVRQGTGTKMTATGEGTVPFFLMWCLHKHPHITINFLTHFLSSSTCISQQVAHIKGLCSRGRACGDLRLAEVIRQ